MSVSFVFIDLKWLRKYILIKYILFFLCVFFLVCKKTILAVKQNKEWSMSTTSPLCSCAIILYLNQMIRSLIQLLTQSCLNWCVRIYECPKCEDPLNPKTLYSETESEREALGWFSSEKCKYSTDWIEINWMLLHEIISLRN